MITYIKHKLKNLISINKIITLYYFEFDKNFIFNEELHDFWEVVVPLKENIICTSDDEEFTLNEGQMLFHKPNERHSLKSNKIKAPNVFIISFECHSEAMKFFRDKIITLTKNQLSILYSIIEIGKKTFNMHSDPKYKKLKLINNPMLGGEQMIKNYVELLLIDIMRKESESSTSSDVFLKKDDLEYKLIDDIIKMLNKNIYNNISLLDICNFTSYSRSYILKKFKSATGKGIIEYYINLRIEVAKQLIRENELSIKEISEKLCFDTPNYFTKTFKRVTSFTPMEYKKATLNI